MEPADAPSVQTDVASLPTLPDLDAAAPGPSIDRFAASPPPSCFSTFACCWLAVLLMHIAIVLAYSFQAVLFAYVDATANVRTMVAYLGDSTVDFLPPVAGVSGMNAGLHGLATLYVIFWSLRYCTLVFSKPEAPTADAQQQPRSSSMFRLVTRFCRGTGNTGTTTEQDKPWRFTLLGLGIHDLELALDLALQTYEAEKISRLVTREWISRFASIVLVANCWVSPLVSLILRSHPTVTRDVIRLLLDSLLTMLFWILVPAAIVYPYCRAFDSETQAFPFINYYMDAWYIRAFLENRQFFITSGIDFVAKMLPGLALLLRLHQLKGLLTLRKEFVVKGIQPSRGIEAGAGEQPANFLDKSTRVKCKIVVKWLYNLVLLGWGIAVLALHSHATAVARNDGDAGCLLEVQPWGSNTYTCVVLEVSCTQKQIKGEMSKVQEALDNIDIGRVQGLVFSHCPALEMPSQLQNASQLQVLKIHNTTVSEWSANAALTAATHPMMQQLFVSLTNLPGSTIPDGLLSSSFPPTLFDMSFCGTDLTGLPDDVYKKWTGVQYLTLELSPGIKKVPSALGKMPSCEWLSLAGDAIVGIPDLRFSDASFFQLYLDGNPLQALPSRLGDVSRTQIVGITNTEVSSVPASWSSFGATSAVLAASGSPLCQDSTSPSSGSLKLDCSAAYENTHLFPLEWEQYWRKKNRK